ncbi:hypothetical protein LAZ67_9001840 [Cordylochernes scorpioides]|uniref:C2H2-type domain-containing protein n=1 Tax=Cordylochernes scorpioides TaxID=51811 RepID=A0ABY6KTU3_9ARAC|nr:hypothetical protein LAZ67_9001840 [Cordylochernes scorpioides]
MAVVDKNLHVSENFWNSGNYRKTKKAPKKENIYRCKYCEFVTAHRYSLNRHSQIHTGEKNFKCNKCNYRSIQKSDVTKHAVCHTGKKPYACTATNQPAVTPRSARMRGGGGHVGNTVAVRSKTDGHHGGRLFTSIHLNKTFSNFITFA